MAYEYYTEATIDATKDVAAEAISNTTTAVTSAVGGIVNMNPIVTNDDAKKGTGWFWFFLVFGLVWALLGLGAFIMALACIGYSGTTAQKIIGILLAMFFGPFYWIYYFVSSSYCSNNMYMTGGKRRRN